MESPEPQWLPLDQLQPDSGRVAETKKHLRFPKIYTYISYILSNYRFILFIHMFTDMKYDLVDLIEGHSNNS